MLYAKTLIDKALRMTAGSRYQIADTIGIDESFLAKIYHGKKPIPPLVAAKIANMIGEDEAEAALMALTESENDEQEKDQFRSWFRIPTHAIAAVAICAFGAASDNANASPSLSNAEPVDCYVNSYMEPNPSPPS